VTLPSQRDRVLKALRDAGPNGVDTTAFLAPSVIDGQKPILRLAARVRDLRDQGHRITSQRLMNGTVRYFLQECSSALNPSDGSVREPADISSSDRHVVEGGATALFDEAVGRVTRSAVLEDA
jgi:hypothetical protein